MVREQEKREKERQIFGAMERRMKGKAKGVEKSSEKIGKAKIGKIIEDM